MFKNKILFPVLIALFLILILAAYIIRFTTVGKNPHIGFYRTNPEQYSRLIELMSSAETGLGKEFFIIEYDGKSNLEEQFKKDPCDILITENFTLTESWDNLLFPVDAALIERYPRSTRLLTEYKGANLVLPLQFDHIELAYKRSDIKGDPETSIIYSFDNLNTQLTSLAGKDRYPLLLSGAEDRDLMDIISVLTLSIAGPDGLESLRSRFDKSSDLEELLNLELREGITFRNILNVLTNWKNNGIVSRDWLHFTFDDVLFFLENDLSSACIMRLSTHRTLPDSLLNDLSESPFPFLSKDDRASALLMPGYSMALSSKSLFKRSITTILPDLLENDILAGLSAYSGLAPASSTSEALDRQASNVRLWGAASMALLNPLSDLNSQLIEELREYLLIQ
ncbi:hypothetical protein [Spirochaeta isovalerica]|uniref:Uncharacterized protein n=1 Tax=Spirochaeta isovalerica TaxID=150 RepID=A0A841R9Y8_9SPIO|nr:hypothetical protein [Spirochaeta isovalerica]MBB6479518.1 hypothetical protein [Spirochaeta isovalerica]